MAPDRWSESLGVPRRTGFADHSSEVVAASLSFNLSSRRLGPEMREVVSIHIGQAGIQVRIDLEIADRSRCRQAEFLLGGQRMLGTVLP